MHASCYCHYSLARYFSHFPRQEVLVNLINYLENIFCDKHRDPALIA